MEHAAVEQQGSTEFKAVAIPVIPVLGPAKAPVWKDFVQLAKPGILFSNLMTAFGGFWVASKWDIDWTLLMFTLIGTMLIVASGCVLNNYLDRDLDGKMKRTLKRALPSGSIQPATARSYGIVLGAAGLLLLGLFVNAMTALLGVSGLFVYVYVYTAWLKRKSVWSTVVGGISGAIPPVIGYCAVTSRMDIGALVLFAILFLWQPPHFWALGIRRMGEYRLAGYPLLPVVKGAYPAKIGMMKYVIFLVPVSLLLYMYHFTGVLYLVSASVLGIIWMFLCIRGFTAKDDAHWSKVVFIYSITYLALLFLVMVIDTL